MTKNERASQIWGILAIAASRRIILTYEEVAQAIGLFPTIGQCLEPIQSYCLLNGLPALSVLAVSKKTGTPGIGFIATEDLPQEQMNVFNFDWLNHRSPKPEDLKKAVEELPTNGVGLKIISAKVRGLGKYYEDGSEH